MAFTVAVHQRRELENSYNLLMLLCTYIVQTTMNVYVKYHLKHQIDFGLENKSTQVTLCY